MKKLLTTTLSIALTLLLTLPAMAQDAPGNPDAKEDTEKKDTKKKKGKTFSDVITDEAESDEGLFTVHKVGSKYYFEIPDEVLGKDILLVSRISGFVKNFSFGGAGQRRGEQVIHLQKHDDKILMRAVSFEATADEDDPVKLSVERNNFEPVIEAFKIETMNEDSTGVVIDVTAMFTSDVAMIDPFRSQAEKRRFGIRSLDKGRSMINFMKAFPENVEVRHILTYQGTELPDNRSTETLSIEMNQSFILLPEDPWKMRYYDSRVGYFGRTKTNYSWDEHKAETRASSTAGAWTL
jgi:hypothetical protein